MKVGIMPHDVKKEITVTELRNGDRFTDTGTPVTNVTRKQKWAIIELNGERTVRMQLDAPVTVLRTEATLEEKAERMREYMIEKLRNNLRNALAQNPAALLNKILAGTPPTDGALFTWSNLPDVLRAQAMYKIALVITHCARLVDDRRGTPANVNDPDDVACVDPEVLLEAYALWYYEVERNARRPRDPLSCSTSTVENLLEDVDAWAKAEFVNRLAWTGAIEEIERRVVIIKEQHDS